MVLSLKLRSERRGVQPPVEPLLLRERERCVTNGKSWREARWKIVLDAIIRGSPSNDHS